MASKLMVTIEAVTEDERDRRRLIARFTCFHFASVFVKGLQANPGNLWAAYIKTKNGETPVYF